MDSDKYEVIYCPKMMNIEYIATFVINYVWSDFIKIISNQEHT